MRELAAVLWAMLLLMCALRVYAESNTTTEDSS